MDYFLFFSLDFNLYFFFVLFKKQTHVFISLTNCGFVLRKIKNKNFNKMWQVKK